MKRYILLFIISFPILVISKIPAQLIFNNINNLSASGITGTIWNGKSEIAIINNLVVNNLEWDIDIYSIFLIRLNGRLRGNLNSGLFESNFSITKDKVYLYELIADFSLAELYQFIPIDQVNGSISASFRKIELSYNKLPLVYGDIYINNLNIPLIYTTSNNQRVDLGSFKLIFPDKESDDINASIISLENEPIEVKGNLIYKLDSAYDVSGLVKYNENIDTLLAQGINFMTSVPNESGFREFSFIGSL
tara:strand:- start:7947 stop:8693 length:747 start_codon:yes stop_codon:yes gene_type:complete